MDSVFFPNLLFEEELHGSTVVSASASRRVADLAVLIGLLAKSEAESGRLADVVILAENQHPGELPECLQNVRYQTETEFRRVGDQQLVPWGWSSRARRVSDRLGFPDSGPTESSVSAVNSRRFLQRMDLTCAVADETATRVAKALAPIPSCAPVAGRTELQRLQTAAAEQLSPSFGRVCHSENEVDDAIESVCCETISDWVIKAEFSQAARNRILGRGRMIPDSNRGWLRKQIAGGGIVYVEPWFDRVAECGLQFEISSTATSHLDRIPQTTADPIADDGIRFVGATRLLNDANGHYRGSVVAGNEAVDEIWEPAIRHGYKVADATRQIGYFGPLGIDCMVYHDSSGRSRIRLSHDLNGRWTMGRIALSLRPWLKSAELGVWCHFPADRRYPDGFPFATKLPKSVRTMRTSPLVIEKRPIGTMTALLASVDPTDLRYAFELVTTSAAHITAQKS